MEYNNCYLCKEQKATKTNSHIIPSFLIAEVCSYDGSGKRDKEVMFTMTELEDKIYMGSVPTTKYEELFDVDNLSDERIEEELKNNTASEDYILCPTCESDLSKYLETPYAEYDKQGKQIDVLTQYFFWVSVVWRISISDQFKIKLPEEIKNNLRENLNLFIRSRKDNEYSFHNTTKMSYKFLIAQDYDPHKLFIGGTYDHENQILYFTIGRRVLVFLFDNSEIPEEFNYLELNQNIKIAPINNGSKAEDRFNITADDLNKSNESQQKALAIIRVKNEELLANTLWERIGLSGVMPQDMFKEFIQELYSENTKQGDRKTSDRYLELYEKILNKYGYNKIINTK